jgi:hypothetical protein
VGKIKRMKFRFEYSKLITLFHASRPKFLVASVAPVLVGSCLGYAAVGSFNWPLFILALLARTLISSNFGKFKTISVQNNLFVANIVPDTPRHN